LYGASKIADSRLAFGTDGPVWLGPKGVQSRKACGNRQDRHHAITAGWGASLYGGDVASHHLGFKVGSLTGGKGIAGDVVAHGVERERGKSRSRKAVLKLTR
jgi:hypothetical protein